MQKLRPPTWRRSRTPTPVEMRVGGEATLPSPGAAGSCDSLSRQASLSTSNATAEYLPAPQHHHHLLLPVDPAAGGTSRARSRSFDCAAAPSVTDATTEPPASPSPYHSQSNAAGPLLGMLRRSFSRHSSTSEAAAASSSVDGRNLSAMGGSAVCIHCLCVEEYERIQLGGQLTDGPESEYDDSYPSSAGSDPDDQQLLRLSFLGESFECRQKVEPWIRENDAGMAGRAHIRRGGSLGLAPPSSASLDPAGGGAGIHPLLRRGGSECVQPAHRHHHHPPPEHQSSLTLPGIRPAVSFNFSFSSVSSGGGSQYQVSSTDGGHLARCSTPTSASGRRSPSTPRLERQEALCSGWLETEPSLELPSHHHHHHRPSQASMETHASVSLEVDSGLSGGRHRGARTSLESQSSLPTLSFDVVQQLAPASRSNSNVRLSSLESENSVESMASFQLLPSHRSASGGGSSRGSLLARRKCLSAGASPNSSPPCSLSAKSSGYPGRLNLCATGGSYSSSADYGDASALSPSPPAEIYLTVPVLPPPPTAVSPSPSGGKPSLLLRQRFRGRNDSSRSSSDRDASSSLPPPPPPPTPPLPRPLAACSSLHARGLSRSGDSLHPRSDPPLRSRSIEIGLPTAHHRTEYHDLAGSARRQQWVSRLK